MSPSLLSSNLDAVAGTGAKGTDLEDWKLSSLPSIMVRGWDYHNPQHRREISEATRSWRSVLRRGVATIRGLLSS
jgi:hypothetical protein